LYNVIIMTGKKRGKGSISASKKPVYQEDRLVFFVLILVVGLFLFPSVKPSQSVSSESVNDSNIDPGFSSNKSENKVSDRHLIASKMSDGNTYYNSGDYERAILAFDEVLKINSEHVEALYNKGLSLAFLGRNVEAAELFGRVYESNPDYLDVRYNYAGMLLQIGFFEESIKIYDAVLAINSGRASAWHSRGVALINLGRGAEALESLNKALEINPNNPGTKDAIEFLNSN